AMGGLSKLIGDNENVLIKPNCVTSEVYPTTSDVNSLVSTIEQLQAVTSGTITVGDAGWQNSAIVYQYLDYDGIIPPTGAELILFSDTYNVRRESWEPERPDFMVYSDIYDSPVIIDHCCLKRHFRSGLTCGLKHHVGSVSGSYGSDTREYFHTFPAYSDTFMQLIAEFAGLVNSELTIVDARSILAVNGPARSHGGEEREINRLVISGDKLAAEVYSSQLMAQYDETYNPDLVIPIHEHAATLGLGTLNLNDVEVIEISATFVDDNQSTIPDGFELRQNYPNPFNARTSISFDIPHKSDIEVSIYNSLGQKLATLHNGRIEAGKHSLSWDAGRFSSGVYFAKLHIGNRILSRKMTLLK
ncbi:MAG: DUF362 domain-containing protein, partial [candidate division Zixibacteria bacterium]|nr:DUF362 domain-containing protein [candidate division Zixibacteria bacterium]